MSIAAAQTFENGISLRAVRKPGKTAFVAGAILTAATLVPFAVAAFGIARGGIEPYIFLAALVLG